ncbi:hypothetical protein CCM_00924 [Cordyceps militaris CM01]|uniref:Uncharacterized protein n=1 Tax=Cordyceps militaris (strain CM01) TaxID=983644 RepID=G3J798_CORMM|nr:uncharacterized protein CCM_00924 [Cordyceps militaris CM01]EGX96268.1 hypothetical protein CCM_00924 [Cordyceps militaris CM01]
MHSVYWPPSPWLRDLSNRPGVNDETDKRRGLRRRDMLVIVSGLFLEQDSSTTTISPKAGQRGERVALAHFGKTQQCRRPPRSAGVIWVISVRFTAKLARPVLVQIVSGLERVAGPGHRKALLECGNIRQPTEYTEGEGRSTRIGNFCHRYKHQGRHPPRKWRIPPSTANTTCSFFVGRQSWNRGEDRTSVTSTCECYWRKSTTKKSLTVKTPRGSTTANSRASRQTGNRPAAGKLALDSFFPDSHGAGRITCFRMLGSIQTRDPCEGVSKSLEGAPTLRSGDAPQWRGVREREPGWGCTVHTIQTQTWLSLASFFVGTRRWRPARVPSSGRATFGADTVTIGFVAASAVHTTPRRNQQDCPTLGLRDSRRPEPSLADDIQGLDASRATSRSMAAPQSSPFSALVYFVIPPWPLRAWPCGKPMVSCISIMGPSFMQPCWAREFLDHP